ncbi:MAG: MBL fold metallo-hydrolase [Opitutales bacterium]|nr:MBL fold metallo-hydrolase [Opitutales bacterium]MCH8540186.1 MBL fold metallo-hydrolase [Opitutales bacterium]
MRPVEEKPVPLENIPAYRPEYAEVDYGRLYRPDTQRLQITWIGHATFLVQWGGKNFLTDPIYSRCCSPVFLPNLRRRAEPGIPFEKLPKIDAVLLSHDHYDHFDRSTVRRLGPEVQYFFPVGLERIMRRMKLPHRHEADWWQTRSWKDFQVHCVPAQHCSGRGVFDRNKRLWCGWVLEWAGKRLFFAGDTGYSKELFQGLGKRFGPLEVALLPIGAYRPRWIMHPVHMDPREAVEVHVDIQARRSVAGHWGTFRLTDEPMAEPPLFLRAVLEEKGLPQEVFQVPPLGKTLVF